MANYFSFLTFLVIPFLGGNHLPLFFLNIDKFWIETTFVLLLTISVCATFFRNRETPVGFLKFMLFFSPYLLMAAASLLFTWNRFNTLSELNTLAWVVGSVYLFSKSEKKDSLLMALVFGASLTVLCMIIQQEILLPSLSQAFTGGRYSSVVREKAVPFSSYLNEATLGGYFLFAIPLSIYFGLFQKKRFCVFLFSILLLGLLISLSRIGILLGSFSILTSALFILKKRMAKAELLLVSMVILALIGFLGVTHAGNDPHNNAALRDTALRKAATIPEHITTLTYRTVTWKKSIEAFRENPLVGYGAGAFEYAYRKYYDGMLYTRYAHSVLAKVAVEIGLLGLICFLFYFSGLAARLKNIVKDTKHFFILLSVVSGLLFSLCNVTFEIPAYSTTFFLLSSSFFWLDERKIRRGTSLIFLPITAVLLASFLFTVRADASQKLYEDGVIYEENGLWSQALTCYKEALRDMPLKNNGYIGIMSLLAKSYKMEQNLQAKERIKDMIVRYLPEIDNTSDKDSELYVLSGTAHALLGNEKEAEKYFREAMRYHPSSAYYMYETANFYFLHGNTDKARKLIKIMDKYKNRHTGSDMHGLYVYKMRDLQSNIEYLSGNTELALRLAEKNLHDAENDKVVAENIRAREYVTKESFVRYFRLKVEFYESKNRQND